MRRMTVKTAAKVPTGGGPDGILYEPARGEVYAFNGRAHSVTVISPKSASVIATVQLPGKPEFPAAPGSLKVLVYGPR